MDRHACYGLNDPDVVGEILDGELIAVEFHSGCYYSIRGVGADACALLFAGRTVAETIAELAAAYSQPEETIAADLEPFLEELLREQVLRAKSNLPKHPVLITPIAYEAPIAEKFDDMADQLLADPIHDIDDTQWPSQKSA